MEILKPRPYQDETQDALDRDWADGLSRLAVVLPTGMGKTVVMAHRIAREPNRVAVLVHRDELVDQTIEKVHSVAPHLTIGVVKAARDNIDADVVVISIQTIARMNRLEAIPQDWFDLIIIDECHHAAAPSYVRALRWFGCFSEPATRVVGFTATLVRQDRIGLGDVFQKVSYKKDILYGIRHGYLVDPKGKAYGVDGLNLDGVKRSGGDFQDKALGEALLDSEYIGVLIHAIKTDAADRQGIVYAPDVATTISWTVALNAAGISAAFIVGETSKEDRTLIFKRFRAGEIQVLVNCMVLTEGLDIPQLSFVVPRLTSNAGLYVQMVGRALRPWRAHRADSPYPWMRKAKTDALVLHIGASARVRLAALVDLSETVIHEIREDEGLAQAADREEIEAADAAGRAVDPSTITTKDVDLFAGQSEAWLQTIKGYWFIPTKEWLITIYPEDRAESSFKVGRVWCGRGARQKGVTLATGMTLDYAMAWAVSEAEELDPVGTISQKGASWKKKKSVPPTDAQLSYARTLGIKNADSMTKVELSDRMSIVIASRLLDRYEPKG